MLHCLAVFSFVLIVICLFDSRNSVSIASLKSFERLRSLRTFPKAMTMQKMRSWYQVTFIKSSISLMSVVGYSATSSATVSSTSNFSSLLRFEFQTIFPRAIMLIELHLMLRWYWICIDYSPFWSNHLSWSWIFLFSHECRRLLGIFLFVSNSVSFIKKISSVSTRKTHFGRFCLINIRNMKEWNWKLSSAFHRNIIKRNEKAFH